MAERVSDGDGEALVRHEANRGASLWVAPMLESGLEPGRVGSITVVGDELLQRLELHMRRDAVFARPRRVEGTGVWMSELLGRRRVR